MFSKKQLFGVGLPPKHICLTFDDGPGETLTAGPGPKTEQLAEYLSHEKIRATFFVVGKSVEKYPAVMAKLVALGHLVANHTYTHPKLGDLRSLQEVSEEILAAHNTIAPYLKQNVCYFRAPFASWPARFVEGLNQQLPAGVSYIGPVNWDINKDDWEFWKKGKSAEDCAKAYLKKITSVGRGIVLMHDSTANEGSLFEMMRQRNRCFETVKILVPQLKALGYRFVGLDEIPF